MKAKTENELSALPLKYRKTSRNWWVDTSTNKRIHASKIAEYLPKEKQEVKEYWWQKI